MTKEDQDSRERRAASPLRTSRSALALLPPPECWDPIQTLRRAYDRKIGRWMPHVNLLHPFRTSEHADEVEPLLARVAAEHASFELALADVRCFSHGRHSYTIWVAPEPRAPIDALHEHVRALFPDCRDADRHENGFTPHLSLGQAHGQEAMERRLADVRARWRPLSFVIDRMCWVVRAPGEPFRVRSQHAFR